MTIAEIKRMPVGQRMVLMEELWDSLRHENKEPKSPAWHGDILDARRKKLDSGKAKLISIDELRKGGK